MASQKIAIVTPYGAEPRLDNYAEFVLAQTLIERGYPVRMYTYKARGLSGYEQDAVYKTVPVFRCRQRFGFSPKLFFSLLFFRPTTIFCFHPKNELNFTAYWTAKLLGAKFIVEIVGILHDPFIVTDVDDPQDNIIDPPQLITAFGGVLRKPSRSAWNNYILHMPTMRADTIIAINDQEQAYIQRIYGRESVRIYWPTPERSSVEQHAPEGIALPSRFLFFIGQMKRRKGWDTAIDAIAHLAQKGQLEHLVFVSPHPDQAEAQAYAKERGVLERITFLSAISNAEREWLYAHSTYVLIPSRYEGFGLPVFEAFLARKPIFATDIPVFLEFLEHKKNAMIFPIGNGVALGDAIGELDRDVALQTRLVEAGLQTAQDFNYHAMVDRYIMLIQ